MGRKLDASLAVLNGAIGGYLAQSGNGLATEMQLFGAIGGSPVSPGRAASELGGVAPPATRRRQGADSRPRARLSMSTESIWEIDGGGDYGSWLSRDLGHTPLYLRYNSGRAIASNGASLAAVLEALAGRSPGSLEEILLVGHSMGGLVVRSACHAARVEGHRWISLVRRAVYLGTPHLGAPLERIGRVISSVLRAVDDPYTRLISDIADLRSDGLKDLGDADLRHEDRGPKPLASTVPLRDARHPVPLLPSRSSTTSWQGRSRASRSSPRSSATRSSPSRARRRAEPAEALPPGSRHVRLPGMNHIPARQLAGGVRAHSTVVRCRRRGGSGREGEAIMSSLDRLRGLRALLETAVGPGNVRGRARPQGDREPAPSTSSTRSRRSRSPREACASSTTRPSRASTLSIRGVNRLVGAALDLAIDVAEGATEEAREGGREEGVAPKELPVSVTPPDAGPGQAP